MLNFFFGLSLVGLISCVTWNGTTVPPNPYLVFLQPLIPAAAELPTTRGTYYPGNTFYCILDALSKYNPTSTGLLTGTLFRRPGSEHTDINRRVALTWASWLAVQYLEPDLARRPDVIAGFLNSGFNDLYDNTTDVTDPIGLVNTLFPYWKQFLSQDGSNSDGSLDELSRSLRFNKRRYADYTGYRPRNTALGTPDHPNNWQPIPETYLSNKDGYYKDQVFVGPQWGLLPITATADLRDLFDGQFLGPVVYQRNQNGRGRNDHLSFDQQIDKFVNYSAALNDTLKMKAERFDAKIPLQAHLFLTLVFSVPGPVTQSIPWAWQDVTEFWGYFDPLSKDAIVVAWYYKRVFDSVRPVTTLRNLYGDQIFFTYAGPGAGTQTIKGREYTPYLYTMPHPEYPSGSSCLCYAMAEGLKIFFTRFYGSPNFPVPIVTQYPAGSSVREPGITPASPVTLSYTSPDDWAKDCAESRVYGGVHFRKSVKDGEACRLLSRPTFDVIDMYKNGTLTQPLSAQNRVLDPDW